MASEIKASGGSNLKRTNEREPSDGRPDAKHAEVACSNWASAVRPRLIQEPLRTVGTDEDGWAQGVLAAGPGLSPFELFSFTRSSARPAPVPSVQPTG